MFTTRPPIAISPPLMFSRPASIRSSVDLPQPDGPTRTTNWPSSIATLTPCNTLVLPNVFRTSRMSTVAIQPPYRRGDYAPWSWQRLPQRRDTAVSLDVMNSSSAGVPLRVCSMPRLMAGMISAIDVTLSP